MATTEHHERVAFFHEHAGYSYNPATETPEQGRDRCAEELARAEEISQHRGWYVCWEYDPDAVMEDDAGSVELVRDRGWFNLMIVLRGEDGQMLGTLGGVVVETPDDPYVRVVGAELASELLRTHQECRARVTCGGCGHAWCERCDPAPSALCHWCHGRGESDAEMPPAHEHELPDAVTIGLYGFHA